MKDINGDYFSCYHNLVMQPNKRTFRYLIPSCSYFIKFLFCHFNSFFAFSERALVSCGHLLVEFCYYAFVVLMQYSCKNWRGNTIGSWNRFGYWWNCCCRKQSFFNAGKYTTSCSCIMHDHRFLDIFAFD